MNPLEQLATALSFLEGSKDGQIAEARDGLLRLLDSLAADPPNLIPCLYRTAQFVAHSKELDSAEKQLAYEQVMLYLQQVVVRSRFGINVEVLRYLYDMSSDFFKYNNLDRNLDFPIGRDNPLPRYQPALNEECDVVKPYVTMQSSCGWTRCTIVAINGIGQYTVKYANSNEPTLLRDMPWFAPLGSRCRDFDWRMNLKVGDVLDAQDSKTIWYFSTIAETLIENNCKKVRVTFRQFTEEGDKIDSDNRRYRGYGANEDEWLDATSPRLRQPHTMHKRLCYFSSTITNDYHMDDSFDDIFLEDFKRKPFFAVLRTSVSKSQSLTSLFDQFVRLGGIQLFKEMLTNNSSNIDTVFHLSVIIGFMWFIPPRMVTHELHYDLIGLGTNYLLNNVKHLNAARLQGISFMVDALARRLLTLGEKFDHLEKLRRDLILLLLQQNLEKQLLAMRLIHDLIKPARPYTAETKVQFIQYLRDSDLFKKVVNSGTHEQVLSRSVPLLKFLLDNNLLDEQGIDYLWRIYPASDFHGRAVLHKVLGEVVVEMQYQHVEMLVGRIIEIRETDITIDDLALLRSLKNKLYSKECTLRTLEFLWDLLTIKSSNVKLAVEQEVQKVFKGFITTVTDFDIKFQLLKDMAKRLRELKTVKGEPNLLKEYLMTYKEYRPIDEKTSSPTCLPEAMTYLASQDIYEVLYSLIAVQKGDDKIKELLEFMRFLMTNDKQSELSSILRRVYEKLGPTENVLNWLKELGPRSPSFLQWLFEETVPQQEQFKNLTLDGFKAVQSMFVDLNEHLKKLSHYKGKLTVEPKPGDSNKDTIEIEYTNKKDFVYVLVDPTRLSGLQFLQFLLEFVSSQMVYGKIIEFIITLMVSLDDSLLDRAKEIRSSIISMIIEHIRQVNAEPELNDKLKQKLLRNLNLLSQLMVETEINGLFDLQPHFEVSDFAEMITIKFENGVTNSKVAKEFELHVRDNISLWRLKLILSEKLEGESPQKLALYKAKKLLERRQHGKSLSQLSITKGEVIRIETANVDQVPKCHLLDESTGRPTSKFEKVLRKWWELFCRKDGDRQLMNVQDIFRLFKEHTSNPLKEEEALQVVTTFGTDLKLSYEQFVQYMVTRTRTNLTETWKLLNLSGYRNDLRYKEEANYVMPVETLARSILSQNVVYNLLFTMLENPVLKPVHTEIFKFLCTLPTSPVIRQSLTGVAFNPGVFTDVCSQYQISYITTIISHHLAENPQHLYLFAERGGIDSICLKLQSFKFGVEGNVYSIEDRNMLAGMLKILSIFVQLTLAADTMAYTLFDEKLNQLEMWEFVELLDKKLKQPPTEQVAKSLEFISRVEIDSKRITNIVNGLLRSLIVHYNNNYVKEVTVEVVRLCALLSRFNPPDQDLLLTGIMVDSLNIRRSCMNILFMHSRLDKLNVFPLLLRLLAMLPKEEVKWTLVQYFQLLCRLLLEHSTSDNRNQMNYRDLAGELFKKVLEHKSTERRNINYNKDGLLNGYLQVLTTVLSNNPDICPFFSHLKRDIFYRCLFFENPRKRIQAVTLTKEALITQKQSCFFDDYVSCKSENNRKLALDVVLYLYKADPSDSGFLENLVSSVLSELPVKLRKPSLKDSMVGMYNMGCICYINAMLQMLNSIEPFRNGLMMAEAPEAKIINELQRMMSFLFYSQRQDYVPEDFLKCFVPPINPMIQQDTTEFLGMLFDHMENELKKSPYSNLLKSIFEGKTVVQMLCHSCNKKRERREQYFYYTVGVKDKNSLEEALEGMHMGEVISDCLCEQCGQKGDFTKRSVLGDIPNVMIVHLQRIVFNLDVFINTKIHTRLPFPLQLNIEPFTKEGVELRESLGVEYLKKLSENEQQAKKFKQMTLHKRGQKDYIMKLKAIIVHSGSADVGHYYTIVRQEGKWVKLDDSRAQWFSESSIDSECYGGTFIAGEEWANLGEQSKNAYVLIYQKEVKNLIRLNASGQQLHQELSKFAEVAVTEQACVSYSNFKTYNLEKYFREVWLDNHQLMVETHLFGEHYNKDFTAFMEGMLAATNSDRKAELISEVFFRLTSISGETGKLLDLFESCPAGRELHERYLSDSKKVWDMLFHNEKPIRVAMSRYMQHVFVSSFRQDPTNFMPVIQSFVKWLMPLLNTDIAKNWNKCQSFFRLIMRLVHESRSNLELSNFFVEQHLIAQYIDFIMEKESPIKLTHKRHQMGNKYVAVDFAAGVETILELAMRSYLLFGQNVEQVRLPNQFLYHLNREEVLALSCIPFYLKMINQRQALQTLGSLIHRLAIKNLGFSEQISRIILKCLNQTMDRSEYVRPILNLARRLLQIKDEYVLQRMEFIIGYGKIFPSKTYRLNNVDQDLFVYSSTIENIFPIECVLGFLWVTRGNNQLSTVHALAELLEWMIGYEWVGQFVRRQPSPNYTSTYFHDWIRPYLSNVKPLLMEKKMESEAVDKLIGPALECLTRYEKFLAESPAPFNQTVVTGQILVKTPHEKLKVPNAEVYYWVNDLEVYCVKSQPQFENSTNTALAEVTTNGRLEAKNIDPESTVLYFMLPRDAPIALGNGQQAMKIEGPDMGGADPLFGDIPDPVIHTVHTVSQKMEVEVEDTAVSATTGQPITSLSVAKEQQNTAISTKADAAPKQPPGPPVRLDVKGVFTCDYYREVVVENRCDVNKIITVEFDNSMAPQVSNTILPSKVSEIILSHNNESIMILNKLDFRLPWGPTNFRVKVEDGDKWKKVPTKPANYKVYGDIEPEQKPAEPKIEEQIPVEPIQVLHDKMQTENIDFPEEGKPCPSCTFVNPVELMRCELCDNPL